MYLYHGKSLQLHLLILQDILASLRKDIGINFAYIYYNDKDFIKCLVYQSHNKCVPTEHRPAKPARAALKYHEYF